MVFSFIWSTLIYDAIACWTWNSQGWVYKMGGLDFAGGTPVHISSGAAALAYSLMLGKRRGHGTHELNYRPHNVTHIVIGTVFLWVGWFGFNAGSALSANMRVCTVISQYWMYHVNIFLGCHGGCSYQSGCFNRYFPICMSIPYPALTLCVGGITWCLLDWRLERKLSTVGFCSGVVAGLVAITPASGFGLSLLI